MNELEGKLKFTGLKTLTPTHAYEISRHAPDVPEEKFDEALNPGPRPSGTNIPARCR